MLGANGAGKSTLLRIMAGVDNDFSARRGRRPACASASCRRSRSSTPRTTCSATSSRASKPVRALLHRFEEISAKFAEPMDDDAMNALLEEQAKLQDQIDAAGAWELDRTLEIAMDALRCPPGDADVATLSGGERRRVALCRLLLQKPDLLLLDEPTNHLDAESVAWLERFLQEYPGTVVAVTHDRYFLDNVAQWILELDRGRGIPWKGNYSSWLEQKEKRLALEEKQASARPRTLAARARVDPHVAARAPGQGQGAHQRLRGAARRGGAASARHRRDQRSRPARASATWSSRRRACARATATRS